ncbi:hypothetical protein AN401_07175 [Zobellella denitrificans]|uniref:DNA recombination protein RmuC n=1 Tax=Zobellella denitrificans TaxID=347534 RepID=A0A291HNF4_9GAMM|nr:hypothetical protein [Zobellella denitrificans]ATG73664.1 hypothetical protein AN401_07175 [Zobellella denitrificans]
MGAAILLFIAGVALVIWLGAQRGERYKASLEQMTANRDRWQARATALTEDLRQERERAEQAEQAVLTLQGALADIDAGLADAEHAVRQAPPEHNGPVAPVLRRALEALP